MITRERKILVNTNEKKKTTWAIMKEKQNKQSQTMKQNENPENRQEKEGLSMSSSRRTACRLAAVFSLTFPVFASINTLTLLASGETYLGMLEWTQNSGYVVFAGGKMTRKFRRQ